MPPISLLIKPASSLCNLSCQYCFYHEMTSNNLCPNNGIMSEETLETLVKKALAYADHTCSFAFQGGEPTLAGLPFYEQLIALQNQYNHKKVKINNVIQTNGIVLNEEWASFLSKNNFLLGLSLDGPKNINDRYRLHHNGKSSFNRVVQSMQLLNKHQVSYNILSVVTDQASSHAQQIYRFFKKQKIQYMQFIPCLDSLSESHEYNPYSLSSEAYTLFLKDLFDIWHYDVMRGEYISIRYFDNLLGILTGNGSESCDMTGQCSIQYVIESNGNIYPCDFYATDQWCLGNIKEQDLLETASNKKASDFINISIDVNSKCKTCQWMPLCRGGCRRNREPNIDGQLQLNQYCEAYTEFFEYAYPRLNHIAQTLRRKI